MVGSGFPYAEFLPEEGDARGVQIDVDGKMLSLRYPMEVNLVGDSAATLRALEPLLQPKQDRSWRDRIEKSVAQWWSTLEARAMQDAEPLNPQRVFWELSPRLPADALLACDTGTAVHWYSRDLKFRDGMRAAHSGGLASMGAAIPYAIGAKFAYPDRPALAFVGDGAMQMSGLAELVTVAKYWKCWRDPRFIVIVLNNRDLGMVTWEQRVLQGDPKFPASQDVPDFPYAQYARLLGFTAVRIDAPAQIVPALEEALTSTRPALIDVVCDPDMPPLPPHVSAKQARDYLLAVAKGDPDAVDILRKSIRQMFA
jgi:pyruvate dehydrogenase (quinone)